MDQKITRVSTASQTNVEERKVAWEWNDAQRKAFIMCKKIIAKDVTETRILEEIQGKTVKIVVTPIGGQGFIFGRGNQQISSKVIRVVGRENIIVIATKHKLQGLKGLRVDTGDPELDDELRGYLKVVTDYREEHVVNVR